LLCSTHQHRMAAIAIPTEAREGLHNPLSDGVEMNVTHDFQQIRVLLAVVATGPE
jgi:hypothetical protein